MILLWYHLTAMKLITRDTDYAVKSLVFLAKAKEEIVPVSALVRKLKMPLPFLRRILQELNKNGIVKSYKGLGGGFQLARAPQQIFLTDLIKVFQGPPRLNECIFRKKICADRSSCVLRMKIDGIEKQVISALNSISISSLMRSAS